MKHMAISHTVKNMLGLKYVYQLSHSKTNDRYILISTNLHKISIVKASTVTGNDNKMS